MTDIKNGDYVLKDSGTRQSFDTGSRRDTREGKGRFDLIPWQFLRELAELYEAGSIKYGDRNWEKGQPLSRYFDSAIRHLERWQEGQEDENHLVQAVWNVIAIWWTQRQIRKGHLPKELGDFGPLAVEAETPTDVPEYHIESRSITYRGRLFVEARMSNAPPHSYYR